MVTTLFPARDPGHFAAVRRLLDQMAQWDAAMTEAAGYPADSVVAAFYAASASDLRRTFTTAGAGMVLARDGRRIIGCLGYSAFSETEAEVRKFYVLPDARGSGTGGLLLAEVLGMMRADGYRTACLETAAFMSGAIRTYERSGFSPCPPFRPQPDGCDGMNVFFRRPL